jgi:hypothetical protein
MVIVYNGVVIGGADGGAVGRSEPRSTALNCSQARVTAVGDLRLFVFGLVGGVGGRSLTRSF